MTQESDQQPQGPQQVSRRRVLLGAGVLGGAMLGSAAGAAAGFNAGRNAKPPVVDATPGMAKTTVEVAEPIGTDTIAFHGPRQAGIDTPAQAHAVFIGLNLKPDTDADRLQRMLKLLTDDAARLTQGRAILADIDEELAAAPARMTITFGFGEEVFNRTNPGMKPTWLKPLPAYGIDQLQPEYTGGDMVIQLCGDDPTSLAHARRQILKDARAFTDVAWMQTGFTYARGAHPEGHTMRNLFGQIDGTTNPQQGTERAERIIWGQGDIGGQQDLKPWITDGTSMVIRRIAMDLDRWDELDRPAQEEVIGRKLGSGAPLTGEEEHDEPDFNALGPAGFPVISDISHMRRARLDDPDQTMHRRAFNYDDDNAGTATDTHGATGVSQSGLIFVAFQADVDKQYIPVQDRLAETDHLNLWTIPVGSAVFAIPPGCAPGGYIGEQLFS